MEQVKIFKASLFSQDMYELESLINSWLSKNKDKIDIIIEKKEIITGDALIVIIWYEETKE